MRAGCFHKDGSSLLAAETYVFLLYLSLQIWKDDQWNVHGGTGEAYPGEDGQGGAAFWGEAQPWTSCHRPFWDQRCFRYWRVSFGSFSVCWDLRRVDRWLGNEEEAQAVDSSHVDSRKVSPSVRPWPHVAGLWLDVTCHIFSTCVCFECADYQSDSWCWGKLAPMQGFSLLYSSSCLAQGSQLYARGSLWTLQWFIFICFSFLKPWHFILFCCFVAKWCLTLCDSMDCSTQTSLSFTISWSLLKLMSIGSVMPSNHLIADAPFLSCPQSFSESGAFPMNWLFTSGGQGIGASASASVLPMNIQDWFPLGLTGLISLQSKKLSRVFSSTTIWKHQFFSPQPS